MDFKNPIFTSFKPATRTKMIGYTQMITDGVEKKCMCIEKG